MENIEKIIRKKYVFCFYDKNEEYKHLQSFNLPLETEQDLLISEEMDKQINLHLLSEHEKPFYEGFYLKTFMIDEEDQIKLERYFHNPSYAKKEYFNLYDAFHQIYRKALVDRCEEQESHIISIENKDNNTFFKYQEEREDKELDEFLNDYDENIQNIINGDNEKYFLKTGIRFIDDKINSWIKKGENRVIYGYATSGKETSNKL